MQVLNELAAVLKRKLKLTWKETTEALEAVRTLCPSIGPLTLEMHDRALQLGGRHGYSVYDSLMITAALFAQTKILYSEDMNDGQVIEDTLTIRNPFNRT